MNWRLKAAIQRACNYLPVGKQSVYRQLQRYCGGLVKGYDHSFLVSEAARMASMLRDEASFDVSGATLMEVGTGWRVDMPLGFYLCGARRTITADLNRYLVEDLALGTVRFIVENASRMHDVFSFVDTGALDARIEALRGVQSLQDLFRVTGIEYYAPYDCAGTSLPSSSIDLHYSYTVFEHIPADVLAAILREASRLLTPRGVALHHIDLGDHFAQVDGAITPANFLQFSDSDWERYAGTPWSYHNRLREDDYRPIFDRAGHDIIYWKGYVDAPSLDALKKGLPLASKYRDKPLDALSVAILDVISRPRNRQ